MKKPLVYLCARVALDAQALNEKVAAALEAQGFEVFVPHLEDARNPVHKADPFRFDFQKMCAADAVVIVGRLGVDCATEVGWFCGINEAFNNSGFQPFPIIRVGPEMDELSPMLAGFLKSVPTFSADGAAAAAVTLRRMIQEAA